MAPPLSGRRKDLVEKVFHMLMRGNQGADGCLSAQDLFDNYQAGQVPEVSGEPAAECAGGGGGAGAGRSSDVAGRRCAG